MSFKTSLMFALGIGALGSLLVRWVTPSSVSRAVPELGIAACLVSSLVGLTAKRWAMLKAPKVALGVTVGMFFVRILACAAGALWVRAQHQDVAPFVLGFLGAFCALFCVETAFLFSAWRSQPRGAPA
jgi:hypothetical protein